MLVAELDGGRIDAFSAERGPTYHCPKCRGVAVLKKGRKVVHHFAHKPPTDCSWAIGETRAHMEAKVLVSDALKARGLQAEVEFIVKTLSGDRRSDVMAWSPKGLQIAFELQHTPIGLDEMERRASSYARAGIAQIWIPFLKSNVWDEGAPRHGGWFVERYSPRIFERWVHGFNGKNGMWMYDPKDKAFWLGRLAGHQTYVEQTTWYSEGGELNYGGGFFRYSKRFKTLTLEGPFGAEDLLIKVSSRRASSASVYNWPAARVAHLVPALTIRPATPADHAALEALYRAAFPEEDLVPQMRALLAEPSGVISLVAQQGGAVAGHVVFSLCRVAGHDRHVALLGPLCAAPNRQGRGIGLALVKAGFGRLRADGVSAVLVLGDPAYYGRFGFAAGHAIAAPYDIPPEYVAGWQALSLDPDVPLPEGQLAVPPVWQRRELWLP